VTKKLGNLCVAILLSVLSHALVGADDASLLHGMFHWSTFELAQLLHPDGYLAMLALALVMLVTQYVAIASLGALLRPLAHALLGRIGAPCSPDPASGPINRMAR
jgi:hypothetical protein